MSKKYQVLEEKEDLSYKNINKKLRRLYLLHKNDKTALRFIKNYIENELPSMIKKQNDKKNGNAHASLQSRSSAPRDREQIESTRTW